MFFRYTKNKLVKDIRQTVAKVKPELSVEYHSEHEMVNIIDPQKPQDSPARIYLANIFNKLKELKAAERSAILESMLVPVLSDVEPSSDELIQSMTLRARTDNELYIRRCFLGLDNGEPSAPIFFGEAEPYLELILDSEESIATVSQETLAKSEISVDEASSIAHAELARSTDNKQWEPIAKDIWISSYQDDYDFARLVAAGEDLRLPFKSPGILFAPSHSICLITSNDSDETVNQMVELGYQYSENHRPLSSKLWYKQPNEKWLSWHDSTDSSVAAMQLLREISSSYEEQKAYLEQLLEKRGEDSFVANYQVFSKDGKLKSLCVYSLGLPSYLPKTEVVAIFNPDETSEQDSTKEVTWAEFAEIFGDDLKNFDNDVLPRFTLLTVPTAVQLEALLSAKN